MVEERKIEKDNLKRDITLKIIGIQMNADMEEENMEFITEGTLYKKGESLYLTYDEGEISGFEGCKTRLKVTGDVVKMKRIGESIGIDTEIEFQKGKRYNGYYDTAFGTVEMEVLTNDVKNTLTFEGPGDINIDYHISLKGLAEGRNKLNIRVM